MTTLRTEAVKYATFGWGIIRLHWIENGACSCKRADCSSPGKHPLDPKGASNPEHDHERIGRLWDETPNANIGIVTGTSDLIVIDLDSDEARHAFHAKLDDETRRILANAPCVETGRGIHLYLTDPTSGYSPSVGTNGDTGIDIRAGVSYVVAPPSTHANGRTYTWKRYPTDIPPVPTSWLDSYIRQRYEKPVRVYEDADKIISGERNQSLSSLAGTMRKRGFHERAISAALHVMNEDRVNPPLSASEVDSIAHSISGYAPDDVPTNNHRHDLATTIDEIKHRGDEAKYRFLSVAEINALPDIDYLVDGLLPINGYGMIYGRRGSGKTFEALNLALSIATGSPYHGRIVQQGSVAYIMSEGAAGLKRRIAAWSKHHHEPDLSGFYALTQTVQLNDPELRAHLDLAIEQIPGDTKLLIIDTLARSVAGLDENSSADMTRFIGYIDEIRNRRGIAIIPIHHAGWNEGHERGSTVIGDAADWICKIRRDDEKIIVETEKVKDDELPRRLVLEALPIDGTGSIVLVEAEIEQDERIDQLIRYVLNQQGCTLTEAHTHLHEMLGIEGTKSRDNLRKLAQRHTGDLKRSGIRLHRDGDGKPWTFQIITDEISA